MSDPSLDNLLGQLASSNQGADAGDPWAGLEATRPQQTAVASPSEEAASEEDAKLKDLMRQIDQFKDENGIDARPQAAPRVASAPQAEPFIPREPASLHAARLTESEVEALVLKFLLSRGDAMGRDVAEQVKLPFVLVEELLRRMKFDQLLVYRGSAPLNDYIYQLTDLGRERARRLAADCTYFGAAPVSLKDYIVSVKAQSLDNQHPTPEDLALAFQDLLISPKMLARLGPAINSGRGMFLYGAPGNGKTSIAKRVTGAFGQSIWVPRALGVDGEIIRLFDPMNHEEAPLGGSDEPAPLDAAAALLNQTKIDKRWIRIRRPTIVVGGELTMDQLEITASSTTGICEAPMQLKSNCGALVIDDFGRQRIRIDELLNRWIVPLEERVDFLGLSHGRTIQVPFDQLIVFSTNLEPRDLVDEAFLRRIPYKIEVYDPSEEEFRQLFRNMCETFELEYRQEPIDYLIRKHYREAGRPFRCCHPRDLLSQVRDFCRYRNRAPALTPELFDMAVENYFAVM